MKNEIKHLPNGDFEVLPLPENLRRRGKAKTHIGPETADGRRPVHWWSGTEWEHKGWLMPQVS